MPRAGLESDKSGQKLCRGQDFGSQMRAKSPILGEYVWFYLTTTKKMFLINFLLNCIKIETSNKYLEY
jgi:hypothetical protein